MTPITRLLCCIAFMAISFTTQAQQKIAYVDADVIIPNMSNFKKAKSEGEAYGKQLQKMLEGKQAEMKVFYDEVVKNAENMTPKQQQEAEAKLTKMQQDLQQEAQAADGKMNAKEAELIKPVYEEFNVAVTKIAKEGEYTYVIDKKMMIYSDGGIDVTDKVKAALGVN